MSAPCAPAERGPSIGGAPRRGARAACGWVGDPDTGAHTRIIRAYNCGDLSGALGDGHNGQPLMSTQRALGWRRGGVPGGPVAMQPITMTRKVVTAGVLAGLLGLAARRG